MAESSKSVPEIHDSISQQLQEVNKTVANSSRVIENQAKRVIEKESVALKAFKDQAKQDLKHIQQSYTEKEQTVFNILKPAKNSIPHNPYNKSEEVAKEYERILQDNIGKLREIANNDFQISNSNFRKLIEETKEKLHDFIIKTFGEHPVKDDFAKTAGSIFARINEKITKNLSSKSNVPLGYSNVFVHNLHKPSEQIEAERMLQEQFEEELLEFNVQIKKDFEDMSVKITKLVDDTKAKVGETIQLAKETVEGNEFTNTQNANLPPSTTIEQNINNLLNKAGQDIQKAKEKMLKDVTDNKQKINNNAKYCTEKVLGKKYFDGE